LAGRSFSREARYLPQSCRSFYESIHAHRERDLTTGVFEQVATIGSSARSRYASGLPNLALARGPALSARRHFSLVMR
jgi:hypothetical protein